MKTAEKIKEWLKSQEWYDRFVNNTRVYKHDKKEEETILNGYKGFRTITCAFVWTNTPEDTDFWGKANDKFQSWYNDSQEQYIEPTIPTDHKNDRKDNKPRWELLPLEVIEEAVKVYTFGAEKYEANSWQRLENGKERYYAALMRHLVAWRKGEKVDEESGLSTLAHVLWNSIALLWFEMNDGKNDGKIQNTEG